MASKAAVTRTPVLASGSNLTFVFHLAGSNLNTLNENSFVNALSDGSSGAGQGTQFFVARFRGLADGGSDKVPAAIPEPSTYAMLLAGLGLLGIGTRRMRR